MAWDRKTTQDYDPSVWNICPVCRSDQITGHQVDIEFDEAWQEVTCGKCEASWSEVYKATHRENITDNLRFAMKKEA